MYKRSPSAVSRIFPLVSPLNSPIIGGCQTDGCVRRSGCAASAPRPECSGEHRCERDLLAGRTSRHCGIQERCLRQSSGGADRTHPGFGGMAAQEERAQEKRPPQTADRRVRRRRRGARRPVVPQGRPRLPARDAPRDQGRAREAADDRHLQGRPAARRAAAVRADVRKLRLHLAGRRLRRPRLAAKSDLSVSRTRKSHDPDPSLERS
jgi:hypothetical protein